MSLFNKWTDRFLGIILVMAILIEVIPMGAMTGLKKVNFGDNPVSVVRDDETWVVTQYKEDNNIYSLKLNKNTGKCDVTAQSFPISLLGFRFGTPETTYYSVKIKEYEGEGTLVAEATNKNDPSDHFYINDPKKMVPQAASVIAVGAGTWVWWLLYAALASAATIVVGGATYYVADKVISKLKQRQGNRVHFYRAYLWRGRVYVGPRLSDSRAVSVLRWNGGNVFAISRSYAKWAAKNASPIHVALLDRPHGGCGYFYHYHPARGIRGRNYTHYNNNHCWFI